MENEYKVNKYKKACGILRTSCSQYMEILTEPSLSDEEKVKLLTSEMNMLSNNSELSYDELELYDDYSYYIEHSDDFDKYMSHENRRNR